MTSLINNYFSLYESFYIAGESDSSFKVSFSSLCQNKYFYVLDGSDLNKLMSSFVDVESSGSYYSSGDYYFISRGSETVIFSEDYYILLDYEINVIPSTSVEIYGIDILLNICIYR